MKFRSLHDWDLSPSEAIALQKRLASRIDSSTPLGPCELIAGADISHDRFSNTFFAGVIVWRGPSDNVIVERASVVRETNFPYVPGLLSFREAPALLDAFARIRTKPDIVMIDGQGVAHPRGIGIASHVGLWLGVPTIGCAKSRLCGEFRSPSMRMGSSTRLLLGGRAIGRVVRTKRNTNPLFVSAGHRIDVAGAVRVVLSSVRGYRVPEPTRLVHIFVNEERRKGLG